MPGSLLWFPPGGPGNGPMPRPPACIGRTTPRSLTPGAELLSDSRSCFFNKKTCRENRGHPVKITWRNFICCSECSLHQWSKRVKDDSFLLATVDINLAYVGVAMMVASPHLLVKALILHVKSVQMIFQFNISCSDIFCVRFGQSYLPLEGMQLALCELLAHLFILILQESICKPSI